MQKLLLASIVAATLAGMTGSAQQRGAVVFFRVNVVPMDRETVLRDQVVVIRDGVIEEIGPAASATLPTGAIIVQGEGKYLMPALAEMHAHIPGGKAPDELVERTLFLYAANGIGTIRGMLGDPRHLTYRARAAKGEIDSPRIYTSGPSLNGNSVPTPEAAVQAVAAQKAAGYDFLKIHPGIKRDVFDALAAKARDVGIRFAGHVPLDVGLDRALEAKFWTIDHLDGYIEALTDTPQQSQFFGVNLVNAVDESRIPALVQKTKAAGTWMVPTEILLYNSASDEPPESMAQWLEMKHVTPPELVQKWIAQKKEFLAKVPAADRKKFIDLRARLIRALHEGGVPFLLGSDAPQVWNVPGFSVHRELQRLVAIGFTPYQALRTGTVNVAAYFGTSSSTGTIAKGKRADLVLLGGNPLENIANAEFVAGVVLNGRWLSRTDIDERLASGR